MYNFSYFHLCLFESGPRIAWDKFAHVEAISHPRGRWKPTKFHSGTRSFLFCEEHRFSLMIGKNTQDVFDIFCFPIPWKRQYRQVPIMSSSWKVAIMSRAFFKKKIREKALVRVILFLLLYQIPLWNDHFTWRHYTLTKSMDNCQSGLLL